MKWLVMIGVTLLISCSRQAQLEGIWYSDKQDCFVLDGDESMIENKEEYVKTGLSIKQTGNKLKFRNFPYSRLALFKRNIYRYKFKLHYKTVDSFLVSPASRSAKKYYVGRDSIVFKTKYHFADQTNYFTKIIFHSSRCFGYCKDLHLELDYAGNLKVTDNGHGRDGDTAPNDNYFGKVSFEDLDRLRDILKYSQLKTLEWPPQRKCFDAPDYTLILYQNDKRYYFHINAACLPIVSDNLTKYLRRLFVYQTLKKVDTTFSYER